MVVADDKDEFLARALSALASAPRLRLLRQLVVPRTLGEIEVASSHGEKDRLLTRQAVRAQIERLQALGLVRARPSRREYGPTSEYVVNNQALYAIGEGVRGLASLRPSIVVTQPTTPLGEAREEQHALPCLLLVKGIDEGRAFDLRPGERQQWTVGRSPSADVSLDFDPYVSSQHAIIAWEKSAHVLRPASASRNGTFLNFRRLGREESVALAHGDVLGVGRSMLVFWAEKRVVERPK